MKILVDTNVLLRNEQRNDPLHEATREALRRLVGQGGELCIGSQNVVEFWVVLTRPPEANGLGLMPTQAKQEVEGILRAYTVLPDPPDLLRRWFDLC